MSTTIAPRSSIAQLRAIWNEIGPDSCPLHYNFHMHTTCSDGQLNPLQLIHQARDIGLKGLAITDHHTLAGYHQAKELLTASDDPILWSGIELNVWLLDCEVHLLGYGFDPDHRRLTPYLRRQVAQGRDYFASEAIAAIHAAGGLTVLAHPFRYRSSAERLVGAAAEVGVDGVETYYSYSNPCPWVPSSRQTQVALDLARKHSLFTTCGTDTHGPTLLQRI
ncbi:MAG: PHP domain-containing protein [Cyanobacteria bacterium J06597_1]